MRLDRYQSGERYGPSAARCARCRYEINGLAGGACPECGHDVASPVYVNRRGLLALMAIGCGMPGAAWAASFLAPDSIHGLLAAGSKALWAIPMVLLFPGTWAVALSIPASRLVRVDRARKCTLSPQQRYEQIIWTMVTLLTSCMLAFYATRAWLRLLILAQG